MDDIQHIGIVGAGAMGRGIAQIAAQAGFEVLLYDVSEEIAAGAVNHITYFITRAVDKERLTQTEAEAVLNRITTTFVLGDLRTAHFIIEAAPENLALKQDIFKELSQIGSSSIILATNTSTLSVTEIASAVEHPEQVVGMHFFNPPPLMPLVEIIAGSHTSSHVMETTFTLAEKMGKSPVKAKDTPGFIVNRVARPFYLEALRMLEQGVADHETLDRLIREGGGFKMGPFELMDLVGLDINYKASKNVYEAYSHEPRFRPSLLQSRMVASGKLGRKTGHGWYDHSEGNS